MRPLHYSIPLDSVTVAVLQAYAQQRKLPFDVAIAALLYRQAATMSGWPGEAGKALEQAMLQVALPDPDDEDEDPL